MTKENLESLRTECSRLRIAIDDHTLAAVSGGQPVRLPVRDSRLIRNGWSGYLSLYFEVSNNTVFLDRLATIIYHLSTGAPPQQAAITIETTKVRPDCADFRHCLTTCVGQMNEAIGERKLLLELTKPGGFRSSLYSDQP